MNFLATLRLGYTCKMGRMNKGKNDNIFGIFLGDVAHYMKEQDPKNPLGIETIEKRTSTK